MEPGSTFWRVSLVLLGLQMVAAFVVFFGPQLLNPTEHVGAAIFVTGVGLAALAEAW